jgi:stage III sporulation protein AB
LTAARPLLAGLLALVLGLAGVDLGRRRLGRTEALEAVAAGLELLRTEIRYAALPLPAALRRVAGMAPSPASRLFGATAEALDRGAAGEDAVADAMGRLSRDLPLLPRQRLVLAQLGAVLGRSDRDDQADHLTRAIEHLGREAARDRPEAQRQASLWRTLGLLAGVAAAILVL